MLSKRFWVFVLLLALAPGLWARAPLSYAPPSCKITDRYGRPLRNILSGADGVLVPVAIEDVSPWFVLAVLAAEDKRFFEHGGVDIKAAARAAWQNAAGGQILSGASTITQQLVSASRPKDKSLLSKIKQVIDASALEAQMSKEQILEAYFNTINLGGNIYGAEAAASAYFNTTARALSTAQAAFLAGVIKSPAGYNPRKNFTAAKKRQKQVLGLMLKNGYVNQNLYQAALDEQITVNAQNPALSAPHYAEFIKTKLPACRGEARSAIDGNIQAHIEALLPAYVGMFKQNNLTNAAAVVLDNKTGEVLAMAGSAGYFDERAQGYVNGALALRQPGSSLKPFVYALALENGYTANTKIEDEDKFFSGGYRPRNYDEGYHGAPTLREALACSYNIPAVQVASVLGADKILDILKRAGFDSLNKTAQDYGLGLALGNGEVTLLELANAYRALANGGLWSPVVLSLQPALKTAGAPRRVFDEKTAFIITDILADNAARAAAFGMNSPLNMPFNFASKTGTSKDYRDNWAAGYNARFTIAVWTGNFNGEPMRRVSGITGAAPLLRDIAMYLDAAYPSAEAFARPPGVKDEDLRLPPAKAAALAAAAPERKEEGITFPQNGDVFMLDPSYPKEGQQILFKAAAGGDWFVDGAKLPCAARAQSCFWPMQKGRFEVKLDADGKTYKVNFEVL
ncbi:MAG: penicillin-binding protein 1C [Elusimicrobiota bacterium]|jgi:penicillin-binding protein 1C|nr:penicillin-binding protein 1C [Elusimicrobiota bacterium]